MSAFASAAAGGVMRRLILALLLLHLSFAASADDRAELQNLYDALNMLNQQQQAIYQQFQMVQELRFSSTPQIYTPPMGSGEIANYDEAVAAQNQAIQRAGDLYLEADELLAKYSEIEEMKKPLQRRIYELSLEKK
jgi:hypothetical protein